MTSDLSGSVADVLRCFFLKSDRSERESYAVYKIGNMDIEISKLCVGCMSFGKAVKNNIARDKAVIASKVYFNEGRLSRNAILREIDGT